MTFKEKRDKLESLESLKKASKSEIYEDSGTMRI